MIALMTRNRATIFLALNTSGSAPEWIEVLPKGPEIKGRDGRHWKLSDVTKVIQRSLEGSAQLHVDYEHASEIRAPKGEEAPAAGWITALEARDGAVWARVEWTDKARQMIASREYRFISPTFFFDKKSNEVTALTSAALTNQPNLELTALNRAGLEELSRVHPHDDDEDEAAASEETHMDKEQLKALCKKLGLSAEASAEAILAAVDGLIDDKTKALNSAASPSLEKFVPRADYDKVKTEAEDAKKALNTIETAKREAEITAAVDDAVKAGKIAPASKDFYLATCRKDGGLDEFKKFVATAPAITSPSGLDGKQAGATDGTITDAERAVCRAMGLAEDAFKKAKAA